EQAEFESDVTGGNRFPGQSHRDDVGLLGLLRADTVDDAARLADDEVFRKLVRVDVTVAEGTVRRPDLQVGDGSGADVPERLVRYAPAHRRRWEKRPLLVGREFRRPVVASVDFEQVAPLVVVVDTEE